MSSVRRLLLRAQKLHPEYANKARSVPAGTHVVSALLAASDCHVSTQPMDAGVGGLAVPGVMGKRLIVLNARGEDHEFVLRHELKHILADEVSEVPVFLTEEVGEMVWAERTADLFALSDLVPGQIIHRMRRRHRRFAPVMAEVREMIEFFTVGWSEARLQDRAYLRLRFHLDHGV